MMPKCSGVSAASGLLGNRHVTEVSWELGRKVPLQKKTEKSADLTHYFSGVGKFLVNKIQH